MRRIVVLISACVVIAASAKAQTLDYNNFSPTDTYQYYFPGGANLRVLDDVNRISTLPIVRIDILLFNANTFNVDATLYVYDTNPNANGAVNNLLFTSTITGIPYGLNRLNFATPGIASGISSLWIGLSASAAQAGMLMHNPPILGTSADVFAWERQHHHRFERVLLLWWEPCCELRDAGVCARACEHGGARNWIGEPAGASPPTSHLILPLSLRESARWGISSACCFSVAGTLRCTTLRG